jgi:hypothetical protein
MAPALSPPRPQNSEIGVAAKTWRGQQSRPTELAGVVEFPEFVHRDQKMCR